jgi:DNA-binding CsgD family transcriptional regulator
VELQGELLCFEAGRRDRLGRLLEVARSTEGRWAEAAAVLADAFAERSPAGLLEAGERLSAGGWTSYARDCFAEASRGFDRALQRSDARAAWSRKAECDALLGDGVPRPTAGSAGLTPREREVVAFAAAGLSDREIAERLTVSVRTIEGHLYRAYAKLEVTSREQLGAAFGSGGATPAPPGGSEYTRAASK